MYKCFTKSRNEINKNSKRWIRLRWECTFEIMINVRYNVKLALVLL